MYAPVSIRPLRPLTSILAALVLTGCFGQGDGPVSIPNEPAEPLPDLPVGFCDPINFEILCPPPAILNFNGGATTVIDNPDKSGINESDGVAQMQKFPDEVFGGTRFDLPEVIDFSNGTFFKVKVWSPRQVELSFKLETTNQFDDFTLQLNHTGSSSWESLCYDFSASVPTNDAIAYTVIFDLGTLGMADTDPDNWTFFYDDIEQVESCDEDPGPGPGPGDSVEIPVDFEGDPEIYDFGADGGFGGGASDVIANPDMSGLNTTAQTARMQKFAGETFGGSTLSLDTDVDFADGEVFKMKVWSTRMVPVLFKFEGADDSGDRERTVNHMGGSTWEELCFDFTGDNSGAGTNEITFIFENGVAGDAEGAPDDWTFYYDEIEQDTSCAPAPSSALPVDFEDDPTSYDFGMDGGFGGGASDVIANPDASGENTTAQTARMRKFAGEVFGGSTLTLDGNIDFMDGEAFTMKVWSTRVVPVLFKLEGGDDSMDRERSVNTTGGSAWEELCFDFSGDNSGDSTSAITFIFDLGVAGDAENAPNDWTFYFDEIEQVDSCSTTPPPASALPVDFEADAASYDFGMDGGFGGGASDVIANPDMSGLNTTAQTARMRKFAGEVFGGSTLALDGDIDFMGGEAFKMKVWSTRDVPVLFKLEGATDANDKERSVNHPGGSEWQELCFDFTGDNSGDGTNAITFIFDLGTNGDAENAPNDWTFYFDEIEQADSCPPPAAGGTELVSNGDFETGDFTDWEEIPGNGTVSIITPGADGAGSAAQLSIDVPGATLLKQANLGAGQLTNGQTVTVSFDWKGTDAAGGVINVLLFSEGAMGVSKTENIQTGGGFPADWTSFGPSEFTLGDDVTNGLTLQIDATCGGAAGCDSTVQIDNISITAELAGGGGGGGGGGGSSGTSIDFEADAGTYMFTDFNGGVGSVIANPQMTGNPSAQVGRMQKFAGDTFGGTTLALGDTIDFAEGEVFTMNVWSTREVPVLFKLEGTPTKEREVSHTGGSEWQTLCFDFTGDPAGDPTNGITFIFDNGTAGDAGNNADDWTFYFDDIEQVDSCPPVPAPLFPIDYENDINSYTFNDFNGGQGSVIANPQMTGNASAQVGQMQKFAGDTFGGTTQALGEAIDFADGGVFTMKVWSSRSVPVLFKLEGSPSKEREVNHTGGSEWQTLCFDFTADLPGDPSEGITFIFDNGTAGEAGTDPTNWTFYFDDIEQTTSCPSAGGGGQTIDFENAANTYTWSDFAGGQGSVIGNPQMTGNASAQVAQMQKFAGDTFGGTTLTLAETVDFADGGAFTMKVWSPRIVPVLFKLEGTPTKEISKNHSGGSEWQTLCFDFSSDLPGDPVNGITFIFDNGTAGEAGTDPTNWTFYFDDIEQTDSCPPPVGNLVSNGDFETGDFTSWEEIPGNGTISIITPGAGGAGSAAQLSISVAGATLLKQANLAAGSLTAGQTITVSFDWKGTDAAGGVINVLLFSEGSMGVSKTDNIQTGGGFPADWTAFGPSDFTLGPDVANGLTIQIDATCGAAPGCNSTVEIDNISITLN